MSQVKLVLDGARMAQLLRSPQGPVIRLLLERGELFKAAARRQARGRYGTSGTRTGCLERSIVKRIEDAPGGVGLRVFSDTRPCSPNRRAYGLYVHEGTKPHTIEGNPTLAFRWDKGPEGPGMYFFRSVKHPGTKPNRFFTDNMGIFVKR
jgi:hypothetical protein